jgi:urease accessory protein
MMFSSIADLTGESVAARARTESSLDVAFAVAPDGGTYIDRQLARYPFHLCRVLSIPGDPPGFATLYLQSCSGGLYEHDRHRVGIRAASGARAHVTTQASTIVHGMASGGTAVQEVEIAADEGALLEYLPDPLILFAGARLESRLQVTIRRGARILAAESFIFHDPAGGEGVFERLWSRTDVVDESGRLLACDRYAITGSALRSGVSANLRAQGALWLIGHDLPAETVLPALRSAVDGRAQVYAGASLLPGGCGIVLRLLATDGANLRAAMVAAWQEMRLALTGLKPRPRRK